MRRLCQLVLGLVVVACNPDSGDEQGQGAINIPFTPDISINAVMVGQIDHAAHFIWDAADPELSSSEIDWQEVEHHAIQLVSSRAAMTMGGSGVNDAMWIAQSSWRQYVNEMNAGSTLALRAARDRDQQRLQTAGDILVLSCEACHQQFKPDIPTEGLSHPH